MPDISPRTILRSALFGFGFGLVVVVGAQIVVPNSWCSMPTAIR